MHAFVLGGTGQVGSLVVDRLVKQGHTVSTLTRNPDKTSLPDGVIAEKGTPENLADLQRCFSQRAPDVVFVALASATPNLLEKCVTNTVEAMKVHNIRKIVYLSALGVDDSRGGLSWPLQFFVNHSKLEREFKDHGAAEKVLKTMASPNMEWVIVRPALLKPGEASRVETLGDHGEDRKRFMDTITRASVAEFMVEAAEGSKWNGQTPVIVNA